MVNILNNSKTGEFKITFEKNRPTVIVSLNNYKLIDRSSDPQPLNNKINYGDLVPLGKGITVASCLF